MAWPPASSGTWSQRDVFTGDYPGPQNIQYISDNLVYYGDTLGVATYNPTLGTSTIIGDITDWSLGDVFTLEMCMLEGSLFVLVSSFFDPNEKVKVFRYNGTPHSWTLVYLTDDHSPNDGGPLLARVQDGFLISSDEGIMFSGLTPSLGGWVQKSADKGLLTYTPHYIANDGNQSFMLLSEPLDPGPGFDFDLYEYANGAFSLVDTDPAVTDYIRAPGYHWDFAGDAYSIDGVNWVAPSVTTVVAYSLRNYTKIAGFDDGNNRVYYWDDNTNQWSATFDTFTASGVTTPEAFVMSDGTMILGQYSGSSARFYERSDPLDLAYIVPETQETGKRLWIYKSSDGGISWTSRGVRVET